MVLNFTSSFSPRECSLKFNSDKQDLKFVRSLQQSLLEEALERVCVNTAGIHTEMAAPSAACFS